MLRREDGKLVVKPHDHKEECTYCHIYVVDEDKAFIDNKVYHKACAKSLLNKKDNPEAFRAINEIRDFVEDFYNNDDIIVKNAPEIISIARRMKTLKNKQ